MKKQTAVEWLFAEYINPKNQTSMASLFLEALQMEKEQILKGYEDGYYGDVVKHEDEFKNYYTKTYGDK